MTAGRRDAAVTSWQPGDPRRRARAPVIGREGWIEGGRVGSRQRKRKRERERKRRERKRKVGRERGEGIEGEGEGR